MGHLQAEVQKADGIHYTPNLLADFVAKQIVDTWICQPHSSPMRLLDPAVGDGQLLLSLLNTLSERDLPKIEVFGFDTSFEAILTASDRVKDSFSEVPVTLTCTDFLEFVASNYPLNGQYSLFNASVSELFDIVIANPPYVRTQVMGKDKAQSLAKQFGLSGRVDLYYAFLEGIAQVLRPGGVAGIIVSNRFLTTKSGITVRKSIADKFDILHIWDLGDTRLFEAAVLPAVLLLRRKNGMQSHVYPEFTSIYKTSDTPPEFVAKNVFTALNKSGVVQIENDGTYKVQRGQLNYDQNPAKVWRLTTKTSARWLETVEAHTFCTFGDVGKIRVGVKTTADKVFIRSDWQDMSDDDRPELLKPLTTHHIAQRFRAAKAKLKKEILYPHQMYNGVRIAADLSQYPKTARYFLTHRATLEKREYVVKSGRQWYEIWVPHNPEIWLQPKIIFRDITEQPTFWMDLAGSVVNGDCYWLTYNNPEQVELLWLALAVGNSSFIEQFYDYRFNNKLYAGRRRFMTQYVEKFPLPDPTTKISLQIIQLTKQIYERLASASESHQLEDALDHLIWKAFGFSSEEVFGERNL